MTEDSRPDLECVIADGVEYVLHAHDEQTVYYEGAEGHAALSRTSISDTNTLRASA